MNQTPTYSRGDGKPDPVAIFWLAFAHLGALAALFCFSWSALGVCLALLFTISPIGVTLTYHRLLTHRAFAVPKWLEYSLATVGTLSAQGSVLMWAAEHRVHHQTADTIKDPHTPRKGLFFSHMGHLLLDGRRTPEELMRYVPDLASQKYYQFLHRNHLWVSLSIFPLLYWVGGWQYVLWGGFMRVTLMLHITWLVNSATHSWGYRTFETRDDSRNCWWVALLAAGEGWHNNHHAQANCAAHGREWWEIDVTYVMIRGLELMGLATKVVKPIEQVAEEGPEVIAV